MLESAPNPALERLAPASLMSTPEFYNKLAPFYHLIFEDWEASIAHQAGTLDSLIRTNISTAVGSVLDVAFGIGTQALGLAARGYDVTASDISPGAIGRAQAEAARRGLPIKFSIADMRFAYDHHRRAFDVVLCADNSLPHLLSDAEILQALEQPAQKAFHVTGVDRTAFLLEKARMRAAAARVDIAWLQQDMRRFVRPKAFDLVISMMTSFGYFEDRKDDLQLLRNMLTNLKPGGACVIDLKGKECVARSLQPVTAEACDDGTITVKRSRVVDDWTRVRNELLVIREGQPNRTYSFDTTVYSGQELRDRLESAGFVEVKLYGNLNGDEYGLNAQRLIAVARKPSHHP
jgi:2-polyprenyl-3-methyl-5-hydroxy-6-metoxy-1,4-benzoquinol methylase